MLARSGDWIAAGDGLEAFGAALILAVQVHLWTGRITAGQWIYANPGPALRDLQLISIPTRFSSEYPTGRAAARGKLGTFPINAGECPATAAAGKWPCLPPPHHRPRSGGRRWLSDVSHGNAVASSRQPATPGAPIGVTCSAPGHIQELHQQYAPVAAVLFHQAPGGGLLHAGAFTRQLVRCN